MLYIGPPSHGWANLRTPRGYIHLVCFSLYYILFRGRFFFLFIPLLSGKSLLLRPRVRYIERDYCVAASVTFSRVR